jgi:glycosyltransferase involved in cell wall biosynthesis
MSRQPTLLSEPITREATPAGVRDLSADAACRRVLVVIRWPVGGIRTHLQYNYPLLARQGFRFTFVVPATSSLDILRQTLADVPDCEFAVVPVEGLRCRMRRPIRQLLRSGRFALMHSHGLTAATHAALANVLLRVPHLVTVHDPLRPEQFRGLRGAVKRWLLGRVLYQANRFIAVGEDIRANLFEYVPPLRRNRVVVIPNGIDTHHFARSNAPSEQTLRQKLDLSGETVILGFLGRFMEQKGFLPLLDALAQVRSEGAARPFHLVAVGSGDYEREYRKQVERRRLDGCVSMLGFTPDVKPLLEQMDLLVMPSLWEASPLLPMEAMCAGIPVLGTSCIGLREVLRDTPSRTVPAGNSAALAGGLQQALGQLWTEEARAFVPQACRRFDNDPSAVQLLELVDRMAGVR